MKKNNKIKDINEYKKTKQNKHKKRKNKPVRRVYVLAFGGCALATIIVNIGGYATMSDLKYNIVSLEMELRKQEIILEGIKADVGTNTSIDEIESRAKEELNMDYPKDNQIRYICVEK